MQKSLIVLLVGVFFTCSFLPSAYALKTFQIEFYNLYLDKERKSDYAKKVVAAKCWLCHQGKKKKNHNPYGVHLAKLLDKKKHKKDTEAIIAALKKVEQIKTNPGDKKSKTFGNLIKAGKLPGGTLAECKKEPKKKGDEKKGEEKNNEKNKDVADAEESKTDVKTEEKKEE